MAIQAAVHAWMATLDVKDMFFMIPLREEDKPQFAFTWEGVQYTFNRLPQGYKHSPTIAHNALAKLLDTVEVPSDIRIYQYRDDILVGGDNKEQVGQVAKVIWDLLTKNRLDISPSKCQGPGQEIKFLGAWWIAGAVAVPDDTLSAIEKGQTPGNKTELQQLLDYLQRAYFKDPKRYRWAFGISALETEETEQLSTLPGLLEDPSVVGLLRVEEQQVPITTTVHRRQYRTNRDSLVPIPKLIHQLESQGVISRTRSPFNSPIWPVWKSNGEWRLTVDYRGLNEAMLLLSAAVPNMLELQYELESKTAKWYAPIDIANAFFSIPLAGECRPQFALTWRDIQYTWNRLPQGWKHSPTICHGLIQTALEQGEAPEHLQYIDDIIIWGNSTEVSEKGKNIVQILLKANLAIKRSKVKGPAQEIQVLGIKRKDGHCQIPMDEMINKIAAMPPQTSQKGNPNRPGILEVITDWPEGKDFGMSPEEEVTCTEEAPPYNKLTENEKPYALFTDGSCHIVGKHQRWKAAVWSPT
ncbi:hypothetical protein GRJ2_002799200 [Grus japonensis]|uniref:ribonuclease H n=1 Tax=Grus japonensis TaxID=30415 RepID=A0ABC9Y074_GRUJA